MLHINDLTYRIDGRILFDQATLAVTKGAKFGLVGRNGTGKSTLFHLIKGSLSPDDGSISIRKGARLGAVDQEVPSGPESLMQTVLAADKERTALLAEAETATDPERIADIHTRLSDIDAYSAEARAGSILSGLGFSGAEQQKPCSEFSGGWRMRVALAAMLFASPDILLLDEPTNYLDLEGAIWLENHLRSYPGTAFIISHDRDFLNTSVTHIAHLRMGKLFSYPGNYDNFERVVAEQNRLSMNLMAKQEDERRKLESFVNRFKAKASKAKQAQSRVKRLEKMQPVATIVSEPIPPIDLPSPGRALNPPIVRFDDVTLGYEPGKPVLRHVNAYIDNDDRIGILGRNGEGKSTFAKAVIGLLDAQEGFIKRHKKLRIGYFAQHEIDAINVEQSPYEHVVALMPDATEAQRRARLARFGLGRANAETPAGKLSGGEKARLLFSLISFDAPHLLVLDEPTNHLDMDSRAELIKALNAYEGAVLLISHDRNLIESIVDRLWVVGRGTIDPFDGTLEDYRKLQLERERAGAKPKTKPNSKADQRRASAQARAALAPMRKSIQTLENRIESLKADLDKLDHELADPDLFAKNRDLAIKLGQRRSQTLEDIERCENDWLKAVDAYEQAKTSGTTAG
ncbi:MAG TPA: ABC transporter ATP-binding protein [Hellea balneolensis]|uniref:ABC transporter ATP-binding protein n=1 Tax=Hellea balneolensis TaxID=287478 RepID=A0A7C5LS79_9PROT|nr:ABC transporter ATP-binding protein [Hellea balneolensis]